MAKKENNNGRRRCFEVGSALSAMTGSLLSAIEAAGRRDRKHLQSSLEDALSNVQELRKKDAISEKAETAFTVRAALVSVKLRPALAFQKKEIGEDLRLLGDAAGEIVADSYKTCGVPLPGLEGRRR